MRKSHKTLVIACVLAAGAIVVPASSASNRSQMPRETIAQVRELLTDQPLVLLTCPAGCVYDGVSSGYVQVRVKVVAASVRGLGTSKRVDGQPTFTTFEIHACAIDYSAGAERVSTHIRWHSTSGLETRSHVPGTPGALPQTSKLKALWESLKELIANGAPQGQIQQAGEAYKKAAAAAGTEKIWGPAYAEDWNHHGVSPPLLHPGC